MGNETSLVVIQQPPTLCFSFGSVNCKAPGSAHDTTVLHQSELFKAYTYL